MNMNRYSVGDVVECPESHWGDHKVGFNEEMEANFVGKPLVITGCSTDEDDSEPYYIYRCRLMYGDSDGRRRDSWLFVEDWLIPLFEKEIKESKSLSEFIRGLA